MSYIVALTGGIGSGKSTIANLFAALGVPVIDADIIARNIVEKGSPLLAQIVAHFGKQILFENGELNRTALRQRIFQTEYERLWLNQLLHPAIHTEMLKQLNESRSPYVIWVVPLLIENQLMALCDRILVVDVLPEIQLERAMKRDKSNVEMIKSIMLSQVDRQTRLNYANDVIENNLPFGDNEVHLTHQVAKLNEYYLTLSKTKGK
ncbi:dephospho-CoA kinase [Glaesserella parasuis]|uniref:dephospho-CoA kinase n=1 Tax=Glaesserella parasuis TaxID=738 RepID=UPI00047E818A|nr:dephospho-CoA kinase [Glaesserella parasuis]MDP0328561.1 dephospho-CoA kinase [Glaesserella parasuis]MDP0390530.1 dephospho-CoA kinase [Glaesserella parasuis]